MYDDKIYKQNHGCAMGSPVSPVVANLCMESAPQENPNSFAVPPFINGVTQPLTRILHRHDIQVVNKPFKTLQQEFPSPKFRPSIEYHPNVVYKIPCADCDWCYVGETGWCFETRKKEPIMNIKTCANGQTL